MLPPLRTVERWLWEYVLTTDLAHKLGPPSVPLQWEEHPPARRIARPGRPPELQLVPRAYKSRRPGSLRHARGQARLLHTFVHHELQAAELMAWAILAFPETPPAFRRGLLSTLEDEVRHMGYYVRYMQKINAAFGDFPVRDWFWQRVPSVETPAQFVAVMGVGFEGGNLDHTVRFARMFRDAGAEEAACLVETIGAEEVRHVRFAATWFRRFLGGLDFDTWRAQLPKPLSPILMRGVVLNRRDRKRAGLGDPFLDQLDAWS